MVVIESQQVPQQVIFYLSLAYLVKSSLHVCITHLFPKVNDLLDLLDKLPVYCVHLR